MQMPHEQDWIRLKGEIQRLWGGITDEEIEQGKDNPAQIARLIQERYDLTEEQATQKLDDVMRRYKKTSQDTRLQTMGPDYTTSPSLEEKAEENLKNMEQLKKDQSRNVPSEEPWQKSASA